MRRIILLAFIAAALIISSGCARGLTQEDHRQSLLQTREAIKREIAAGNVEAIFSFWTDDMVIYPVGESAVRGKAAVREYVRRNRQDLGIRPRTHIVEVVASESGDLGYIIGTHEWVDREGHATMPGRYVTLWRRNEQREWKCFLEIQSPRRLIDPLLTAQNQIPGEALPGGRLTHGIAPACALSARLPRRFRWRSESACTSCNFASP